MDFVPFVRRVHTRYFRLHQVLSKASLSVPPSPVPPDMALFPNLLTHTINTRPSVKALSFPVSDIHFANFGSGFAREPPISSGSHSSLSPFLTSFQHASGLAIFPNANYKKSLTSLPSVPEYHTDMNSPGAQSNSGTWKRKWKEKGMACKPFQPLTRLHALYATDPKTFFVLGRNRSTYRPRTIFKKSSKFILCNDVASSPSVCSRYHTGTALQLTFLGLCDPIFARKVGIKGMGIMRTCHQSKPEQDVRLRAISLFLLVLKLLFV